MSQSIIQLYEIIISLMCMDGGALSTAEHQFVGQGIENVLASFVRITQS
jgi:hypothetical protein